jgi:2-desacetyl-2-hydroxyethyl bacteriochlorophyllide A dehydrogenase
MPDEQVSAFWITGRNQAELRPVALPDCGPDSVRVRTLYSAISRGTEALVFNGNVPASEYQRMRAPFQEGNFPAPVKYGYSNVGIVERGSSQLQGQLVFCLYPHQTHYVVPVSAVTPIPPNVPPGRAVLTANLETAINGVWDAGIQPGDIVSVVGAGAVGCLLAWLVGRIPGCRVELIDTNLTRKSIADTLGVDFALPAAARPEADVVVHASGSSSGLSTALKLAAFEATVLEMSWYGDKPVSVALGSEFHSRRLNLRASQVGHVALRQRARWSFERRLALALELLAEPALDGLITGESMFEDLPQIMAQLALNSERTICHRIRYR